MSIIDPFAPLKNRIDLADANIDRNKFYHTVFFNNGRLDTRPIKITDIYSVHSSNAGTKYIGTEVMWQYHFETEKKIYKKIFDPVFWKRIFYKHQNNYEKISVKRKIDYTGDCDTLELGLIGEIPDEAKLRLIMAGLNTPFPDDNGRLEILYSELEYYKETNPDLVLKAMEYKQDAQKGNITDYSEHFLNIKGDLRLKDGV